MSASPQEEEGVQVTPEGASASTKAVAVVIGGVVFVAVIPGVLYLASGALYQWFLLHWLPSLKSVLSVGSLLLGLFILAWGALTHVTTGQGTPVPLVPSQKLMVTGPYRFCRNPLQLGAMIYYFGLGTYFGSFRIGLVMFVLTLILAGGYHKFYEEKRLLAKYGKEYDEYRQKTPFLIPRW
ncbi:MAG: isoprenylcysteine carboxylmethyltransferase family protein [Desulfomonile tiedjei]|nr:isoprenylcysteine carboxylmethyltransferase family protein [Desulfomonile tiedjei]